jgi:hypothetical protein
MSSYETKGSGDRDNNAIGSNSERERKSNRSGNSDSTTSQLGNHNVTWCYNV